MGMPGGIPGTLDICCTACTASRRLKVAGGRHSRAELPLAVAAVIMGGNARVGFEDNILLPRRAREGQRAASGKGGADLARGGKAGRLAG